MSTRPVAEISEASADPSPDRLQRNLASLSIGSPGAAELVSASAGPHQVAFAVADDGLLTGSVTEATGRRVSLASARRPGEEAARLAERVDIDKAAAVVVMGFAMGHHVREIVRRTKSSAVVIIYEPDIPLLRGVLERQDHAGWLCDPLVRFVTDETDGVAMSRALEGCEGLVSMGLEIAAHPPSAARLGDRAARMQATLIETVRSIRTHVVTTLAQADVTIRNQLMNLDVYAASPGIEPLRGVCVGRPAIVVSAGPSVQRNLHLLAEPGVRERFVLIATQTMLRPMLDLGVRPHFVTALDYHEISRRFYEGLSADDVEGVTLVAEAKANAAIFGAWPGAVRVPADGFLDRVLGGALTEGAGPKGVLQAGSTVAHLAYYLARFLGCDPVALIGQDLGFTDGQYYGSGAAIHTVWGSELNEFCTLESLEWQRIKRMGGRLIAATDHLGRPVYTDEQMHAYRLQFERDFEADAAVGKTVIDATEGGVAKASTVPMTLRDAIASLEGGPAVELPADDRRLAGPPAGPPDGPTLRAALDRLRAVRAGVWRVAELSRRGCEVIDEMADHAEDQPRVNRLIERAYALRDEVKSIDPAWELVHAINQRGTFNRARADRAIHLAGDDPYAKQRAQMRRDADNLRGLIDAAETLGELMDAAIRAHDGRSPKLTRETPAAKKLAATGEDRPSVWAAVTVDPDRSDLGIARDLLSPIAGGKTALRLTLERLAEVRGLSGIAIATAHRGPAAEAAGVDPAGGRIGPLEIRFVEVEGDPIRDRCDVIRGARAASARCWRGGIGGWTYADEVVHPDALLDVFAATGAAALLLAGADWSLVDPVLGTAMVERHAEALQTNKLVFSQAAVGLSPVLVARDLVASIADKRAQAGSFASVGSVLGYIPVQPANDPIAGPACVSIEPAVRDLGQRVTLDTPERVARYARLAASPAGSLAELADRLAASEPARCPSPEHLILELVDLDGTALPFERARGLIREAAGARPDAAITLTAARSAHAVADALDHPDLVRLIGAARGGGALWVHVRTPALAGNDALVAASAAGIDALSVDLIAHAPDTYQMLAGRDGYTASREAVQAVMDRRGAAPPPGGAHLPWLVARITRRDAVYEQIDDMYDRWLLTAGAAVIDPLPEAVGGERIGPIALPAQAQARLDRTTAIVAADGTMGGVSTKDGLLAAWRGTLAGGGEAATGGGGAEAGAAA